MEKKMEAEKYIIESEKSIILVIDLQDRLMGAMNSEDRDLVEYNAGILLETARSFKIPAIVTEQYPKGLGPTVVTLKEYLNSSTRIEKIDFPVTGDTNFLAELDKYKKEGRDTIIVGGAETHVCVLQSVLHLLKMGFKVFIAEDAVVSRDEFNYEMALEVMNAAGAVVYTTEIIAFMLMKQAGSPEFKKVSALIKG